MAPGRRSAALATRALQRPRPPGRARLIDVVEVDDPADPRLADYVDLTDPELRRRREHEGTGFFIAEGVLVLRQLLMSTYRVRSVLLTRPRLDDLSDHLDDCAAPVYLAGRDLMRRVTGFDLHRGAVASADRRPLPSLDELVHGARRLLVLEDVNDHENLGSLFRNAAAFGVDGVLLSPRCSDPLYRRAVRVSMGHVVHVPYTRVDRWPEGLDALREGGLHVVALTPDPAACPIADAGLAAVERLAVLVGAEGLGLAEATLAHVDACVRIPMAAGVDSLNVATAAAIALHHHASEASE